MYAPKVLQAPFEGGTDGDGLPPSFDMAARGAEFKVRVCACARVVVVVVVVVVATSGLQDALQCTVG